MFEKWSKMSKSIGDLMTERKRGKKVDGALKSFELFPRTLKNPLRVSHNLNPLTIRGGVGGQFL